MEVLLFIIVISVAWFWYNGSRAHEQAEIAARRGCQQHGVQLLDETVVLEKIRPRRGRDGQMRVRREYSFEFTGEGELRLKGQVVVFAGRAYELQLHFPSGTTYEH